jgi:hypothetical protein
VGSWFDNNNRRVVGDGRSTYFWTDNWMGDVPLGVRFQRLFDLAVSEGSTMEEMARLGVG